MKFCFSFSDYCAITESRSEYSYRMVHSLEHGQSTFAPLIDLATAQAKSLISFSAGVPKLFLLEVQN